VTPLHAALVWLLVAVCSVTYGLVVVEIARIVRTALGFRKRVARLSELPVFAALPKAQADLGRLGNAASEAQSQLARAAWAVARIRGTAHAIVGFVHSVRGA
jgi:hypothetical protein